MSERKDLSKTALLRQSFRLNQMVGARFAHGEKLFFMFLMPYGQRFENRVFTRAAARLFQNPNLITRLSKLWSPEDILKTLRAAEQTSSPPAGVLAAV